MWGGGGGGGGCMVDPSGPRPSIYIHEYIYTWLTARGRIHFAIPFRYPIIAKADGKVAETP